MGEAFSRHGEMRNTYKMLTGRPEGKRKFESSRHSWKDNIKINLRDTGWEGVDWIHVAQNRD
jgi:hypothetical protein